MITFEGINENFKFLIHETTNQVQSTRIFVQNPSRSLYTKITSRDDYIDNLKTIIENKCFSMIHSEKDLSGKEVDIIRSIHVCGLNLERIADFCVNIVKQMQYISTPNFLHDYDYQSMFEEIETGLSRILEVCDKESMPGALAICRSEYELDRMYKDIFERILMEMETRGNAKDCITTVFIFRYLERIGDSLLNIGEALIFSIIGEKIKIEQFDALRNTLSKSGFSSDFESIDFKAIWGTRSGCHIGKVDHKGSAPAGDGAHGGIYKEGNLEKIKQEKANIERWAKLFPNLVPDIYGYHEDEKKGALLVEFLTGCSFDEVILTGSQELLQNAFFIFAQTVREIWQATRKDNAVQTTYMSQLMDRLPSIRQVHPAFFRMFQTLGGTSVISTQSLIKDCQKLEAGLAAPFTVLIHGDFNINNMVYDHAQQAVKYIDLYRSRDFDYVQDASVFLVSNFRVPIFERSLRTRLDWVIEEFYSFVSDFARDNKDTTFEARMAFALARSFYTSTRFELNHRFAKVMYHRAHFLLEKIQAFGDGNWEEFRLPQEILFY
jgi:phosphate uptake regulator